MDNNYSSEIISFQLNVWNKKDALIDLFALLDNMTIESKYM